MISYSVVQKVQHCKVVAEVKIRFLSRQHKLMQAALCCKDQPPEL